MLEAYVELDRSREELAEDGFDPDVVDRALAMIDRAEYKRRQAPPGVKLRPKAFGRDRRTPITNRWRAADPATRATVPGLLETRRGSGEVREDRAEDRHGDRQREARPADDDERRPRRLRAALRISACRRGPKTKLCRYEAVTRPTERPTFTQSTVWNGERPSLQSWLGELDAGERGDEQRAVAERAPAEAELLHRRAARLALEDADRRDAREDERDRAADPDEAASRWTMTMTSSTRSG